MSKNVEVIAETPEGKEIGYCFKPGTSLYQIAFASGGQLPKELEGVFSNLHAVQGKVAAYLASKEKPKRSK